MYIKAQFLLTVISLFAHFFQVETECCELWYPHLTWTIAVFLHWICKEAELDLYSFKKFGNSDLDVFGDINSKRQLSSITSTDFDIPSLFSKVVSSMFRSLVIKWKKHMIPDNFTDHTVSWKTCTWSWTFFTLCSQQQGVLYY